MVVVPLSHAANEFEPQACAPEADSTNWALIASGGTLVAAGLLLLTGRPRAGILAAATGTALAMLDQQQTVRSWWILLPGYIDGVQRLLNQVQDTVQQVAEKREQLHRVLARTSNF
jgi:hypothetical protein